jgi:hypothetical protein
VHKLQSTTSEASVSSATWGHGGSVFISDEHGMTRQMGTTGSIIFKPLMTGIAQGLA